MTIFNSKNAIVNYCELMEKVVETAPTVSDVEVAQ
jgi:hypothetical protein